MGPGEPQKRGEPGKLKESGKPREPEEPKGNPEKYWDQEEPVELNVAFHDSLTGLRTSGIKFEQSHKHT